MKKRFHKINIEISNICNLQCSFCPEVQRPKKLMDLDLFGKIIEQAAPLTEQVCFHLMGDPLVHPDLEKMVEICAHYQVPIFLVTNGVLLRDKTIKALLSPQFRQINFSLHSYPDNHPDRDPTPYLEKVFSFVDQAMQEFPNLFINYRLWNLDAPNGKNENNLLMLKKIEERYQWQAPSAIDVRENKSIWITKKLFLHFDTEFTWPSMDLPVLGTSGTCYGLRSHIGILVDGTVVPCCLDHQGAIPLGRLSERSLLEILEGDKAQAILKGFRERRLVEDLCQRCQYIERFQ
ncbi:MAG: radical SAM/SPASM domain-containing protein [Bdellovibrionia bacterium]